MPSAKPTAREPACTQPPGGTQCLKSHSEPSMSDTHDAHGHHDDPNSAPLHTDVRPTFSGGAVLFCYVLAAITLVAGVITGLTIINN